MIKTEVADVAAPRVLELLVPHDPDVSDVSGSLPVTLTLTAALEPQLEFPGGVMRDAECINVDVGCPRCKFLVLLRSLVRLQQRGDVQISAEYVVNLERNYALLRLRMEVRNQVALDEFELVKSHLQAPAESGETARARRRKARESTCHIVGCTLHRWKHRRATVASVKQEKREPVAKQEPVTKQEAVPVETPSRRPAAPVTIDLTLSSDSEQEDVRQRNVPVQEDRPAATTAVQVESAPELMEEHSELPMQEDGPVSPLPDEVSAKKLNLPDVYHSLMTRIDGVSTDMWGDVVPGLELTLYEHQRRGLSWMLKREKPALWNTVLWHPFSAPRSVGDEQLVIHHSDRELEREFNETAYDACGGMLCDEPGLGKTITMLSLILLSKGETTSKFPARVDPPSGKTSQRQLRSATLERSIRPEDLVSSAASLIVAPDALVEHWAEQIEAHVTPSVLRFYVDEDGELPSSAKLAKYDVVITSFSRMNREWKLHRPPSTLEARRTQRYGFEDQPARYLDGNVRGEVSSLLKIHWLRVVVDEGHKLGGRAPTNLMQISRLLCAERRWVMTGTPSPNTLQSADLLYLHGLLVFLRNQPYGRPDGTAWNRAIAAPFEKNQLAGFYRLQHLLKRIMIRHTKDSIRDKLPQPVRRTVVIAPTPSEYKLYNGIAESVRANLVISEIDPDSSLTEHPDCLLNPKNRKNAAKVETNLILASIGGYFGEWMLEEEGREYTLDQLQKLRLEESRMASIVAYLNTVRPRKPTVCGDCCEPRKTLLILPCGHLSCAYCVEDSKSDHGEPRCYHCYKSFSEDEMDFLQPTRTGELTERGRKNTIEKLRMNGVGESRIARVNAYLNKLEPNPPTECRSCKRRLFFLLILPCGHMCCTDCVEKRFRVVGPSCCACHEQYDRGDFVRLQPGVYFAPPEEDKRKKPVKKKRKRAAPIRLLNVKRDFWQVDSSKIFYMATRIRELKKEFARSRKDVKAIIFSQYRESIWRTKIAFEQQDIPTANFIALISSHDRIQFLEDFRSDPSTNVLLLSNLGSHGLDLSFVTHIFLLEEIWDKSVEQQVISRAHRMGAHHSVVVEQLWTEGSVECQTMARIGQQRERASGSTNDARTGSQHQPTRGEVIEASSADKSSFQQIRLNYILNNLRVLRKEVAAKDGEVRFTVFNEDGATIRRGIHTISESGEVTTTSITEEPVPEPLAVSTTDGSATPEPDPINPPQTGSHITVIEDSSSESDAANEADDEVGDDNEYAYESEGNQSDGDEENAAVPEPAPEMPPTLEIKAEHMETTSVQQNNECIYIDDDETESE